MNLSHVILGITFPDIIVLSIIIIILSLVIYFSFFKKDKNPCSSCPYAKKCDKINYKKETCDDLKK